MLFVEVKQFKTFMEMYYNITTQT